MESTIYRLYELLLADPKKDSDYTEGNEVGGYKVYGSALEMKDNFSKIFGINPIGSPLVILGVTPIWHFENCTVIYTSKHDNEIPNKPECFGYLTVVGSESNVDKVNKILTDAFPRIDDLVNNYKYE